MGVLGSDDRRSYVLPAEHFDEAAGAWAGGRFVSLAPQPQTVALLEPNEPRISAAAVVAFVACACAELPAIIAHDFGSVIATVTLILLFWALARDVLIKRHVDDR
jgi:hypothetical protein